MEQYALGRMIGRGAFAIVFAAREVNVIKGQDSAVAIKIIDLDSCSTDLEDIRQEVATLRLCSHPNVLKFHSAFVEYVSMFLRLAIYQPNIVLASFKRAGKHELWLVTSLMKKGSCLHVMNMAARRGLPPGMHEDWLCWILQETLKALDYFHAQNQIHRDVKAGNILLDANGNVALADFGVSRWVNQNSSQRADGKEKAMTFVGTPCWMAPEVMEQLDGYDFKADIWSLGITALELAKGQAPYATYAPMKVLLYTIQNEPPSLKSYADERRDNTPFSRAFKEFVRACLQKDPRRRPAASDILAGSRLFTSKILTPHKLKEELLNYVSNVDDFPGNPDLSQRPPGTQAVDVRAELASLPSLSIEITDGREAAESVVNPENSSSAVKEENGQSESFGMSERAKNGCLADMVAAVTAAVETTTVNDAICVDHGVSFEHQSNLAGGIQWDFTEQENAALNAEIAETAIAAGTTVEQVLRTRGTGLGEMSASCVNTKEEVSSFTSTCATAPPLNKTDSNATDGLLSLIDELGGEHFTRRTD